MPPWSRVSSLVGFAIPASRLHCTLRARLLTVQDCFCNPSAAGDRYAQWLVGYYFCSSFFSVTFGQTAEQNYLCASSFLRAILVPRYFASNNMVPISLASQPIVSQAALPVSELSVLPREQRRLQLLRLPRWRHQSSCRHRLPPFGEVPVLPLPPRQPPRPSTSPELESASKVYPRMG